MSAARAFRSGIPAIAGSGKDWPNGLAIWGAVSYFKMSVCCMLLYVVNSLGKARKFFSPCGMPREGKALNAGTQSAHLSGKAAMLLGVMLVLGAGDLVAQQLAFPSAEGFGRFATGGRGGVVCHVDNLGDSASNGGLLNGGPHYRGSARYCLQTLNVPRMIVFDVGGVITLGSSLDVRRPNFYLACQTAPGQGVYFKSSKTRIQTRDVIIRHCRFRSGKWGLDGSTSATDTFLIGYYDNVRDVIVDHSEFLWGRDETLNVVGGKSGVDGKNTCAALGAACVRDVTIQWSTTAENFGGDAAGGGGSSGSVAKNDLMYGLTRISQLYTLSMHAVRRGPFLYQGEAELIGNLRYNFSFSGEATFNLRPFWDTLTLSMVGNYFQNGPDSKGSSVAELSSMDKPYAQNSSWYVHGNRHSARRPNDSLAEQAIFISWDSFREARKLSAPPPNFIQEPAGGWPTAEQYRAAVIENVGPTVPVRDSTSSRLIADVVEGTGRIVRDLRDIPGGTWPTLPSASRPSSYDSDGDGMPDSWEDANGFNRNDSSDGAEIAANGYSNLENYLNALAGDTVSGSPSSGSAVPSPPTNLTISK